jgi:hypothetical protein
MSINACDWSYIAEGRANVVWAYEGASPSLKGKVLRLRKKRRSAADLANADEDASVAFTNRVLSLLLPPESCVQLESLPVTRDALLAFAAVYDALPQARNVHDAVDTGRAFAVVAESMLASPEGGTVVSVEIKVRRVLAASTD